MTTLDLVTNTLDVIMAIWLVLALLAAGWQACYATRDLLHLLKHRIDRGVWHVRGGLDLRSLWIEDYVGKAWQVASFALIPLVWVGISWGAA